MSHYAVWYGERADDDTTPHCRTVPIELCTPVDRVDHYH